MFGKHHASMYCGSMIGAGPMVFAVMGYVIAHSKPPAYEVELNPGLLAFTIGGTVEEVNAAIEKLCSPDPNSRSKEQDGRRLVRRGQFLYHVVNGMKYYDLQVDAERKSLWREQKRVKREKEAQVDVPVPSSLSGSAEFMECWEMWLQHLKDKKKWPTVHARKLQLRKLEEMGVERAVIAIRHSVENGWQGLYEPRRQDGGMQFVKQEPDPNSVSSYQ